MQAKLPLLRKSVIHNLSIAQQRQKRRYDEGRHTVHYSIGDLVQVYYPVRRRGLSESLLHRWIGPYRVHKKIRENTYILERLSNNSCTTTHVIRIKRYFSPNNQIELNPIIEGWAEMTSTHPNDFQNEGRGVESEPGNGSDSISVWASYKQGS